MPAPQAGRCCRCPGPPGPGPEPKARRGGRAANGRDAARGGCDTPPLRVGAGMCRRGIGDRRDPGRGACVSRAPRRTRAPERAAGPARQTSQALCRARVPRIEFRVPARAATARRSVRAPGLRGRAARSLARGASRHRTQALRGLRPAWPRAHFGSALLAPRCLRGSPPGHTRLGSGRGPPGDLRGRGQGRGLGEPAPRRPLQPDPAGRRRRRSGDRDAQMVSRR